MAKRIRLAGLVGTSVLLGWSLNLTAGFSSRIYETGEEVGFWNRHSLILAEVIDVERLTAEEYRHGTHRLQVRPKATLSGQFDSARFAKLELGAWFQFWSGCQTVPKKGSQVLIVIRNQDHEYFVSGAMLKFMPGESGLVEVKGFSDPLVGETLEKIQKNRVKLPF